MLHFALTSCRFFVCVRTQWDVLVHRLITLMADTGESKSSENRASDATLACRKLAVSHPVLLLRCVTLHTLHFCY